jgi:hypothetical protein
VGESTLAAEQDERVEGTAGLTRVVSCKHEGRRERGVSSLRAGMGMARTPVQGPFRARLYECQALVRCVWSCERERDDRIR